MPGFLDFHWLARMFTVPRKVRDQIAKIPSAHLIAQAVQSETVAVAQHAVDSLGLEPGLTETIKSAIESHVAQAIPIPAPPANESPVGQLVEGLIGAGLQHLVPVQPVDAVAAGNANAGN